MNKEILKEEVIDSLEIKEYLEEFLNDSETCLQEKITMSIFLNDYIDEPVYIVEVIRDGEVYLRVENGDDEILSKERHMGTVIEDSIEDYELLKGTDHTINHHVDSILEDDSINSDDKIYMIKDFLKYLNRGYYKQDAVNKKGDMLQLILNQKECCFENEIIDKIYY